MKTIFINNQNLQSVHNEAPPCVMALGYFDGVHLGHQEVIQSARKEADKRGLPLALMSFRPHPINILSKGRREIPQLTTLGEKESQLKELGVDLFYLVEFTLEFAALLPTQFVQDYLVQLGVVHAVAGFDFSYGAKGSAKLEQIHQDSDGEITITKVDCIDYHGEKISSSAIRQRLGSTDVHEIPQFLGKHYTIKAHWDGYELHQIEKTMFPSVGTYKVELLSSNYRITSYLSIDQFGKIKLLNLHKNLPKGIYTIRWLHYVKLSVTTYIEKGV